MSFSAATRAAAAKQTGATAQRAVYVHACEQACVHTSGCEGFILMRANPVRCWRKASLQLPRCVFDTQYAMHVWSYAPPPAPPLPPPAPPLSTQTTAKFFAIGDWNFDHSWENEPDWLPEWVTNKVVCTSTCQGHIADLMRKEAKEFPGYYRMVINAGDNFYPFGVESEKSIALSLSFLCARCC